MKNKIKKVLINTDHENSKKFKEIYRQGKKRQVEIYETAGWKGTLDIIITSKTHYHKQNTYKKNNRKGSWNIFFATGEAGAEITEINRNWKDITEEEFEREHSTNKKIIWNIAEFILTEKFYLQSLEKPYIQ